MTVKPSTETPAASVKDHGATGDGVTDDRAAIQSTVDAVAHDRSTQPVGPGRIQFKGHKAEAGYPFRIWDGQVQALVGEEWVDAPDSTVL